MNRILGSLVLILLVCLSTAWAQEITGRLEGRIFDSEGKALAGVAVVARGAALQGERQAVTDDEGYFRMPAMPVGAYRVTVRHVAFHETTLEGVAVRLGKTTSVQDIQLEIKALEMPPVIVVGERPLLDPTPAAGGGNLDEDEFQYVPSERNYRSLVSLLPQANVSYLGDEANIGGATGLENMYYIDGINVTDPYEATTGTNLPHNFIKEIELKTGGYQAEFGRATGGIVNVITGSGSNEFRGDAFGYYTGDSLAGDAKPGALDMTVGGFSDYDAGVTLGGPIRKDRLWYFFAYNRAAVTKDVEIPGFGFSPDEETVDMFAGKLNWKVNSDTDLEFTAFGDPSNRNFIGPIWSLGASPSELENPDALLGYEESGGTNVSLSARTFVGKKWLIHASLARYERNSKLHGGTEIARTEPNFQDLTTGIWSGGLGSSEDVQSERWSVNADATVFIGRHTLKAGVQYEDNSVDYFRQETYPGFITYDGISPYQAVDTLMDVEASNHIPSVFIQDAWRVADRWRLNLGLRWDGQYLYGAEGRAQTITDQWQPRLGFSYQPGRLGTQKLYGSAGRYYGQLPLYFGSSFHTAYDQTIKVYSVDPREEPENYDVAYQFGTDEPLISEIPGLKGESYDEFVLGYERLVGRQFKVTARGTYRTLNDALTTAFIPGTFTFIAGNPGRGDLSFLDEVERDYWSLELTFLGSGGPRFDFLASYVLSRNEGNFPGLYDSDNRLVNTNNSIMFRMPEQMPNNSGLLPNDRTHAFKLSGAYRLDNGLSFGASAHYMSGTPLNEFGAGPGDIGAFHYIFLVKRGSAGRTPSIWDLNLRMQYAMGASKRVQPTIVLDALHLGSQREVVVTEQLHFFRQDLDGNQILPNPNYLQPIRHQSPMLIRLGVKLDF